MLLQLTSDQELLRETTAGVPRQTVPPSELRRLRDDPVGFADVWWKRGAELGWTSLLVSEEHGGGSISNRGLVDLSPRARVRTARRASPLVTTSVVAAALSAVGGEAHAPVLARLLSGDAIATWCLIAEPRPNDRLGAIALEIRRDGGDVPAPVASSVRSGGRRREPPCWSRDAAATDSRRCWSPPTRPA